MSVNVFLSIVILVGLFSIIIIEKCMFVRFFYFFIFVCVCVCVLDAEYEWV